MIALPDDQHRPVAGPHPSLAPRPHVPLPPRPSLARRSHVALRSRPARFTNSRPRYSRQPPDPISLQPHIARMLLPDRQTVLVEPPDYRRQPPRIPIFMIREIECAKRIGCVSAEDRRFRT